MSVSRAKSSTMQGRERVPIPHLVGVDIPVGYKLPDLTLVREQASRADTMMKEPLPNDIQGFSKDKKPIGMLHPGLVYQQSLLWLYNFSYFCQSDRVPSDIRPQIIWALEWFGDAAENASEEQLRAMGHILKHQTGEKAAMARYILVINCRGKLAEHLLSPDIDRPREALKHAKTMIRVQSERLGSDDMLKNNSELYCFYGCILARARSNDEEAKETLEKFLTKFDEPKTMERPDAIFVVKTKVYLARVLRRVGEKKNSEKLEQWLIRWFKKNPHKVPDHYLEEWFAADIDPDTDPVFIGLGGEKWFTSRVATFKSNQRLSRQCRNCSTTEPAVKLSQCARCKHILYCSKECQQNHWRFHKQECKEHAEQLRKAEQLKKTDPEKGNMAADWITWRSSNFPAESEQSRLNALSMKRDPNRGLTHIIFSHIEHVPGAKSLIDRFEVAAMGIYKIDDVRREIEGLLGLDPGESHPFMGEMLEDFHHRPHENQHPYFELMFSATGKLQAYLSIMSVSKRKLEDMSYDPEWRKNINRKGDAPEKLPLRSGVKDAENVF